MVLAVLYAVVFLNAFGYFLIFPVLMSVLTQPTLLSVSAHSPLAGWLFPLVLGAGSLGAMLGAPLLGRWSDQIGRRRVLLCCTLMTVISLLLPIAGLLTASLTILVVSNLINGVASNNQAIAQAAIVDLSSQRNRKAMRLSIDTCVVCAAMTLAPLAGTVLFVDHLPTWQRVSLPFAAAAGLAVFALLLLWRALPETHTPQLSRTDTRRLNRSFTDIVRMPKAVLWLLGIFVLVQVGWSGFAQYLSLTLMGHWHFSPTQVSWYAAMSGLAMAVGFLAIYPLLLKTLSLKTSAVCSLLLATLSFVLFAVAPSRWMMWVIAWPLAWGIGLYFPTLLTLMSERVDREQQGWLMAVAMGMVSLAWLVTGFTSSYLLHWSVLAPAWVAAVCLGLGTLAMMRFGQPFSR